MTQADDAARVAEAADRLYSQVEVNEATRRLAQDIAESSRGEQLLVLCVMNGGLCATAMLLPHLPNLLRLDYVHATRYRGRVEGEDLHWLAEPHVDLRGENVLVIDDIFDEGQTLQSVHDYCLRQGAASVRTAVLVNKRHDRKPAGFEPDFTALHVPDRYVFGCGMDYQGYLRNMPGIYALSARG